MIPPIIRTECLIFNINIFKELFRDLVVGNLLGDAALVSDVPISNVERRLRSYIDPNIPYRRFRELYTTASFRYTCYNIRSSVMPYPFPTSPRFPRMFLYHDTTHLHQTSYIPPYLYSLCSGQVYLPIGGLGIALLQASQPLQWHPMV